VSRNFELMQQAGKWNFAGPQAEEKPVEKAATKLPDMFAPWAEPRVEPRAEPRFAARLESRPEPRIDPRAPARPFEIRTSKKKRFDPSKFAHEESMRLVQRIFFAQSDHSPKTVVFAGMDHGNGCSWLCARTADTLANNTGGSVCLVDANLRSPSLPAIYGVTNHYGLTDALRQAGPIRSFVKNLATRNLSLLTSGSMDADAANVLNSDGLKARFAELRAEFDYVIVDAPPLTRCADAITLGQVTDGFVMVLEANATRKEVAQMAADNLRAANIQILGAVLNKRTFPIPDALYKKL
jgi:capsular exopolysaccharide synthesis family protein